MNSNEQALTVFIKVLQHPESIIVEWNKTRADKELNHIAIFWEEVVAVLKDERKWRLSSIFRSN